MNFFDEKCIKSASCSLLSLVFCLTLLVLGCASTQKPKAEDIISGIRESVEGIIEGDLDMKFEDLSGSAPKEKKSEDLEVSFEDGMLSCNLKNADLRDVISTIADLADLDFVFSGTVYGRITAKFSDKEVEEGLELILSATGYAFEDKNGVYVISRDELAQEDGVKLQEVQPQYVSAEDLISQIAAYYGLNPALQYSAITKEGDLESDSEYVDEEPKKFLIYGDATEFDAYSTIEEELGIKFFRGPVSLKVKESHIIKAVGRNALYLSGPIDQVNELLDMISVLDQKVEQVKIETWLVEYDDNALREYGIDLSEGLTGKVSDFSIGIASTAIFSLPAILQGLYLNKKKIPGDPDLLIDPSEETLTQYAVKLQALMDKNKLTVSSKPYIVVRSGMLARISAASEQFVVASDPTINVGTLEQVETKTSFNIIPTVISKDLIQIKMNLEQSAFTAPIAGAVLGTNKNTANTTLTVKNGETIIIGGIDSARQSSGERGVPILSKIPLIKYLFKASKSLTETQKVNFYITPYIVHTFERQTVQEKIIKE